MKRILIIEEELSLVNGIALALKDNEFTFVYRYNDASNHYKNAN